MNHNREAEQWVLLGTSPVSKDVWGLNEINFPCGYKMPPGAFAQAGSKLERPGSDDVWAMGGFAFELGKVGKDIPESDALQYLVGYRPWVCVFHNALLDELTLRGHTIEMWDRGVSIFHGLWRQSCQILGDLISIEEMRKLSEIKTVIEYSQKNSEGVSFQNYVHKSEEIIHFMSKFMTLSTGDVYVQGPLAAIRFPKEAESFTFTVGDLTLEAGVDKWQA